MPLRVCALLLICGGCGSGPPEGSGALEGSIRIDGSSTVYPITEAVAEEFMRRHPYVRVTVGVSGTGGGFAKFIRSETDVTNASRPIDVRESAEARREGISYIELPIAYDGLCVVVHPENTWVDYLTVEELKKIYENPEADKFIDSLSDDDVKRFADKLRRGVHMATPVFDGAKERDIEEMLEMAGLNRSGQVTLFDGRTGEPFDRQVTRVEEVGRHARDRLHGQPGAGDAAVGGGRPRRAAARADEPDRQRRQIRL